MGRAVPARWHAALQARAELARVAAVMATDTGDDTAALAKRLKAMGQAGLGP